jgi:hypothetical protein
VNWVEVFAVLVVSHLVGDFLLQTDWQAANKIGGLGPDPVCRRALRDHIATYMLSFVPALVWIGLETTLWRALLSAVLIAVPHWVQDYCRLLDAYMYLVKRVPAIDPGLRVAVDQSFHIVFLFATALLIAG